MLQTSNSRRVYVPNVGTLWTLAAPWVFQVVNESRNKTLAGYLGLLSEAPSWSFPLGDVRGPEGRLDWGQSRAIEKTVTLPAGTSLRVDRIYIRKGEASRFDSLSFILVGERFEKRPVRFFARLADVNRMVVDSN